MSSLAETISNALLAVGPATEDSLRNVLDEFDGMNLSTEERLSSVATAVAAAAFTHHARHKRIYLDAVRTWSLEIAAELQPGPVRFRRQPEDEQIEEAAEILIAGLDQLIEIMSTEGVKTQDRLVTELAVVARVLGQVDPNAIHLALRQVEVALADPLFRPGALVRVPLREMGRPVARDAALGAIHAYGCA